jgi:hypothetical protein
MILKIKSNEKVYTALKEETYKKNIWVNIFKILKLFIKTVENNCTA